MIPTAICFPETPGIATSTTPSPLRSAEIRDPGAQV